MHAADILDGSGVDNRSDAAPSSAASYTLKWPTAVWLALTVFWILSLYFPSNGVSFAKLATNSLYLFASTILLFASFRCSVYPTSRRPATYLGWLIAVLLTYSALMIFRSIDFDSGHLLTLLANPFFGAGVWFMPVMYFAGRESRITSVLFRWFRIHMLLGLCLSAIILYDTMWLGHYRDWRDLWTKTGPLFLYPAPVILMTGLNPKDRPLAWIAIVTSIVVNQSLGNRTSTIVSAFTFILALVLGGSSKLTPLLAKSTLVVVVLSGLALLFGDQLAELVDSSWLIDTRSFLLSELSADLSAVDWTIGRGALGGYYSPYFQHLAWMGIAGDFWIRQESEIGYLHLALKGGIILASLYVVTLLVGIKQALLSPHRRLGFGVAFLLALQLVEMTVSDEPQFDFEHLWIWLLLGYVVSLGSRPSGEPQ